MVDLHEFCLPSVCAGLRVEDVNDGLGEENGDDAVTTSNVATISMACATKTISDAETCSAAFPRQGSI